MFLEQPKDLIAVAKRDAITGPEQLPTEFSENVSAAFDYFRSEDSSDSARRHWETQLNQRAAQIEQLTGAAPEAYSVYYGIPQDALDKPEEFIERGTITEIDAQNLRRARANIEKLREQYPEIPTDDELRARIPVEAKRIRDRFEDVTRRSESRVGTFVGTMGGAAVDPINIASMVVAAPVATAKSLGILARTIRAAGIGAGTTAASEAAIQPFVYDFKQQIGVDYSVGDALGNVGAAAIGGGLLFGVGVNVPPLARSSMRGMAETYRRLVKKGKIAPTEEADAAAHVIETMADIAEANPLVKTVDGHEAHLKATDQALRDLSEGRPANVSNIIKGHEPPAMPAGRHTLADSDPLLVHTHTIATPEREALRTQIVTELVGDAPAAKGKPIAYLMGGGGGSGKGTLLKRLRKAGEIPETGAVHIDPDDIKARIPEYRKLIDARDSRAAAVVHEESSLIADRVQQAAIERKASVVIDKTLSDPAKAARLIDTLKAAGYEVHLYGVTVEVSKAVDRAIARGAKGGRYVPLDRLIEAHRGFADGFETYAQSVDVAHLFDNSGDQPLRLAIKAKGGKLEVRDPIGYNSFVARRSRDVLPETETQGSGARPTRQPAGDHAGGDRSGPSRGTAEVRPTGRERQASHGRVAGERLAPQSSAFADDPHTKALTEVERAEVEALLTRLGDDFEIPIEIRQSADGKRTEIVTARARDLIEDIELKEQTLANIITCITGGAGGKAA